MQFTVDHRNIIAHLFSFINDSTSFYHLLQLNKLFHHIGKEHVETKKVQFRRLHKSLTCYYYHLPDGTKHGLYQSYYPNGRLKSQVNYTDGQMDGIYSVRFNGLLQQEMRWVKGIAEGKYREWYVNGNLKYEYNNCNGKKHGVYKSWYENGTLFIKCNYVDGEIDGIYRTWYSDGKPREECHYVCGQKHGPYKLYYHTGEVEEGTFIHGHKV